MSIKFDKTDPVHNALKEGLAKLLKDYFAGILGAGASQPQPRRAVRTKGASKSARSHTMSRAGREAISRASKKRWAKWRRDQKANGKGNGKV